MQNHGAGIQPCTCELKALQEPNAPRRYGDDGSKVKAAHLGLEKRRDLVAEADAEGEPGVGEEEEEEQGEEEHKWGGGAR